MTKFTDAFLDELRQRVPLVATVVKAVMLTKASPRHRDGNVSAAFPVKHWRLDSQIKCST